MDLKAEFPAEVITFAGNLKIYQFNLRFRCWDGVTFHRIASKGRSRQIIIPMRARSRSIENVTDARARAECIRQSLAGVVCHPRTDVFMELCLKHNSLPPRNDYPPEAVYWLGCEK